MSKETGPVASVISYTDDRYHRNYKIEWYRDVDAGTLLFTSADMERFALSVRNSALARVAQSLPDALPTEPKPVSIPETMRKLGYTEREIALVVELLSNEAGRTKELVMASCQSRCYEIGGPWVTFDPDCPVHGYEAQRRETEDNDGLDKLQQEIDALGRRITAMEERCAKLDSIEADILRRLSKYPQL